MRMLCDGCDRVRRLVGSPDGRTLLCPRCRFTVWWVEHVRHGRAPRW